jgi:hypothetical protein
MEELNLITPLLYLYINGEKRWLWTTYDEDWNIISSNEYIVW